MRSAESTLRLPGLKPGVCSGLILSSALNPDLKIGVWRRRTYQSLQIGYLMFWYLSNPLIPYLSSNSIWTRQLLQGKAPKGDWSSLVSTLTQPPWSTP